LLETFVLIIPLFLLESQLDGKNKKKPCLRLARPFGFFYPLAFALPFDQAWSG
jgi:hypothetical protein